MKVIHLPLEAAGQVGEICNALNRHGVHAVGCNWRRRNYLGYDQLTRTDAYELANALDHAIDTFDIFHYHTGYTIFKDKSDLPMVVSAGKKIVMHHRGNDVRIPSLAVKGKYMRNPYVYTGDSLPEEEILRNLRFFSNYVSAAIVQDMELYDYVVDFYEKVHVLPRLIDTKKIRPVYVDKNVKRPLVVHAPTSRRFKGTDHIIKVVNQLRKVALFEFQCLEQCSPKQVMDWFKQADIVIDQILCGAYGNVSVEAMALGKPVICYIRPDIASRSPAHLPIVSAHPDSLYEQLKLLIEDRELRYMKGVQGRHFVEEVHDSDVVVQQLLNIYQSL